MRLFRTKRTRNDRKGKKRKLVSFLDWLLGMKKREVPTYWQLRGRKCKTCDKNWCSKGWKPKHVCCKIYEPVKRGKNV